MFVYPHTPYPYIRYTSRIKYFYRADLALSLLILHNFTRDPQLPSSPSNMHGHTRVGRRFKLGISEVLKHDGRWGKWKYIRQRIQLKEVYELNIRVYSIRQNGFWDEVKLCYVYLRYVDIRLYIEWTLFSNNNLRIHIKCTRIRRVIYIFVHIKWAIQVPPYTYLVVSNSN